MDFDLATKIPITFFNKCGLLPQWAARMLLSEYAANGQKYVVLTDIILRQMLHNLSAVTFYRNALEETGTEFLDAHGIYGPAEDMCCPDEDLRPFMIKNHLASMEIAASFGVKTITIHMGRIEDFTIPSAKYIDYAMDSLDKLLPMAERLGMTICIENVWYPTSSVPVLLNAIEKFRTKSLGICYDAAHANIMSGKDRDPKNRMWAANPGVEPPWNDHVLEDVLPHVVVCHMHDNNAILDQHLLPGKGNVDWKHVMQLLKTAPRLQAIQCEASAIDYFDGMLSVRESVEAMRRLVATGNPRV